MTAKTAHHGPEPLRVIHVLLGKMIDGSVDYMELHRLLRRQDPWYRGVGADFAKIAEFEFRPSADLARFVASMAERSIAVSQSAKLMIEELIRIGGSGQRFGERIALTAPSVAELGFATGGRWEDICSAALESGLQLCPAALALQFRLWYAKQPSGEHLRLAMAPLTVSGSPAIFALERDGDKLGLSSSSGAHDALWSTNDRFVFCQERH